MRSAEGAFRAGDYSGSDSLCRKILREEPQHLAATLLLGMCLAEGQRLAEAGEWITKALRIDPSCYEAHLWLGIVERRAGRPLEAISALRSARRLAPGHPTVHAELGRCYLDQRDGPRAIVSMETAIASAPRDANLRSLLARAYRLIGDPVRAIASLQRATELAPKSPAHHIALANAYLEMGRRPEAVSAFRQAYDLEPETARGLVQLARALREEGSYSEALAALERARQVEPDSVDALEQVSSLFQQMGDFPGAIEAIDRALALEPGRKRLYFNRISASRITEYQRPMVDRMEAMLRSEALDLHEQKNLRYGLGKAYQDLGAYGPAMEHFEEANKVMRKLMADRPYDRDTHRREFDRKITTFSPEFLERNAALGNPSRRPILIIGMIRSGTSLVEQIVSSHPAVAGGGELMYWFDQSRGRIGPGVDLDGEPAADFEKMQKDYLELLGDIGGDRSRTTDKMPHNYMFAGNIHLAFPNAKIIHCRRNPIDNCLSIFTTPFIAPLDFAHDRANIAFVYREYLRLMAHWKAVLPAQNLHSVDYEQLVENPEEATRRLIDFCGLNWDDACLRPQENVRPVKTPSLWQVRQPIYRTSIERWRHFEPWLGEFATLTE